MKTLYAYVAAPFVVGFSLVYWLMGVAPMQASTAPAPVLVGFANDTSQSVYSFRSLEAAAQQFPILLELESEQWNHTMIDCQQECATDQITAMTNCLNRINDEGVACVIAIGTPDMPCVQCCIGLEDSGYDCSGPGYRAMPDTGLSDATPGANE